MFGVVPNWIEVKDGKTKIKPTKEKMIVDNLIKSIGKSVHIKDSSYDSNDEVESDEDDNDDKLNTKGKKKAKNWCSRSCSNSNNRSCQERIIIQDDTAM